MKSAVIDWITPPGQGLSPPLNRKVKTTRGFHHERTGALLCPAGVDWSIPRYAPLYQPPSRNSQRVHSVKAKLKSGEMSVRGDQWPLFLYADLAYDPDDPWNGLLRSQLLVAVCRFYSVIFSILMSQLQGFKHVFTSPSSVDEDEPKATRSGNARIHGMVSVSKASLAYISTQVCPDFGHRRLGCRADVASGSLRLVLV
jgi:hypothetical protein